MWVALWKSSFWQKSRDDIFLSNYNFFAHLWKYLYCSCTMVVCHMYNSSYRLKLIINRWSEYYFLKNICRQHFYKIYCIQSSSQRIRETIYNLNNVLLYFNITFHSIVINISPKLIFRMDTNGVINLVSGLSKHHVYMVYQAFCILLNLSYCDLMSNKSFSATFT